MEATKLQTLAEPSVKHWQQRLLFPHKSVSLIDRGHADEYSNVQAFISDRFYAAFGAKIHSFLPYFLASNTEGYVDSAIGFQPALGQQLFLEQYLQQPIEQSLQTITNGVRRSDIVEIGNLAASLQTGSPLLFILLTAILHQANYQWVVFTATRQVRHLLNKLQLTSYSLGDADPNFLHDKQQQWGSYYQHQPMVLTGHLPTAVNHLQQHPVINSVLDVHAEFILNTAGTLRP